MLKAYGVIPIRLIIIMTNRSGVRVELSPLSMVDCVRLSCVNMISVIGAFIDVSRVFSGWATSHIVNRIEMFRRSIIEVCGINDLYIIGSKTEKISGSMQDLDWFSVGNFEGF